MRKKRRLSVFSLSFLDVMSCGFGAVVLIFLIINHETEEKAEVVNKDLLAEIRLLDYRVRNGEENLFELRERLDATRAGLDNSDRKLASTENDLLQTRNQFGELSERSRAEEESLNELKTDVRDREEDLERLRAVNAANDGMSVRGFAGEGDRQYLTGLKVGGNNILIAVDASASMLDETIVNVLRRRNMPEQRQRLSPKWQRAVNTVEWLSAQLPLDSEFQLFAFNTTANSLLDGSGDQWVPLGDGRDLEAAIGRLKDVIPAQGTSLIGLVTKLRNLDPLPDNVYLIIDSLPTQGMRSPRRPVISGSDRLGLFRDALRELPNQVPINVIMFPMEGDPLAAAAFWNLARTSGGAFMAPSRDWP